MVHPQVNPSLQCYPSAQESSDNGSTARRTSEHPTRRTLSRFSSLTKICIFLCIQGFELCLSIPVTGEELWHRIAIVKLRHVEQLRCEARIRSEDRIRAPLSIVIPALHSPDKRGTLKYKHELIVFVMNPKKTSCTNSLATA